MQFTTTCSLCAIVVALAACHSAEAPVAPNATTIEAKLDLGACAGRAWNGEEFLKQCTQASGLNFTYAGDVAQSLRDTPLRIFGNTRLSRAELETFLAGLLGANGFELRRIGPEHLNVLEVRKKSS